MAYNTLVFHCHDMPTGSWWGFWDFTLGPKVTEQPLLGILSQQIHSQDRKEREMATLSQSLCMEVTQITSTNTWVADRSPSLWEGP